ncbi:MAG: hypothetical protein ACREH4_00010 [Vitreimonas sp.]
MHFDDKEEGRDPFADFGEAEVANDEIALEEFELTSELPIVIEPPPPESVSALPSAASADFSWAAFASGTAALVWIVGAIGGALSYFGLDAVTAMHPVMQVGLIGLALGPALLFWVTASAAGESLKTRRMTVELARFAHDARYPAEAAEEQALRLTSTVRNEIELLNDAVAAALSRLGELERSAQHNASLFTSAIAASRENSEAVAVALRTERAAIAELNTDLASQTDTMTQSISRQIRLMREASKLVKTEIVAAEDALEAHLAAFAASATEMGERTATFHEAADKAAATTTQLSETMAEMLDGLSEATRLTETARKSSEQAVLAANETAGAVRDTTLTAVQEAKHAAQLIRAETAAMQEAANDTMAKLGAAADAARLASQESEAAADRHAAKIEKRLGALASTAGAKRAAAERVEHVEIKPLRRQVVGEEATALHAAANAAMSRVRARVGGRTEFVEQQPRRMFKGFGWTGFLQQREEPPVAANEGSLELAAFSARGRAGPDAELRAGAIALVTGCGVDLSVVLAASDLDRIARASREGPIARRNAVVNAAPGAVGRVARYIKRSAEAHELAARFRARPELAKSDDREEGSDLVRTYLLIDAALA